MYKSRPSTPIGSYGSYFQPLFGGYAVPHKTDAELLAAAQPLYHDPSPAGYPTTSGFSFIDYDQGKQKFNHCLHVKEGEFSCLDIKKGVVYSWPYGAKFCYALVAGMGATPGRYSGYRPTGWCPTAEADLEDLITPYRREAWENLMPQLNTGFSLTNFLLELRDIRDLWKTASKMSRMLRSLDRRIVGTKTLSELILAYSFGVLPLRSDLETIVEDLFNTNKRVNEFIDRGKRVLSYHFRKEWDVENDDVTWRSESPYAQTFRVRKKLFSATLRSSYLYRKPSKLEGFLRVMGLRLTPEIIWNAIPFTFVIDWVLDIQSFLRQFDDDTNLTLNIVDYCDSIKVAETFEQYRRLSATAPSYGTLTARVKLYTADNLADDVIWSYQAQSYLRLPGFPDTGYALPVSDIMSARELVLGGALLRTRIRS